MRFFGAYIWSTYPLIVSVFGGYPFGSKLYLPKKLLGEFKQEISLPPSFRPKYILEHVPGWAAPAYRMAKFKVRQIAHSIERGDYHLFVNARDENWVRQALLIQGAKFSANIYINEHLYRPLHEPKAYDAVYTAQLAAFKRLPLARYVDPLMVISYGGDLHAYCPELKHAEFNREFLPRTEVTKKYNQAYAGLCLSAQEGAMLAACEYLLCGIPVVSTPSKGGRDEFFTQRNSIIVPPDPSKVAEAVQYWKNSPPDPSEIRTEVLSKINSTRLQFCAYIAHLIRKGGGNKKTPEYLMEQYFTNPEGTSARFVEFCDLHKTNLDKFSI